MDNTYSTLNFFGNSTAYGSTIYNGIGDSANFYEDASAGSATLINEGSLYFVGQVNIMSSIGITSEGLPAGIIDIATAANAAITNVDNTGATLSFGIDSTAGEANIYNGLGDTTAFKGNSSAGAATLLNQGSLYFSGDGSGITFSTASSAQITNNGFTQFSDYSIAANASITNVDNANATLIFAENSNADEANLYNGAGDITSFMDDSSAGSATLTNKGEIVFGSEIQSEPLAFPGRPTINNTTAANAAITNIDNTNAILVFVENSTAVKPISITV